MRHTASTQRTVAVPGGRHPGRTRCRYELYGQEELTFILSVLETWEPVAILRTSAVLYALVNTLHIVGLGVLLGAALTLDARVLRWHGSLPLRAAVRELGRARPVWC